MPTFKEEIVKLQQSPIIELYEFDFAKCSGYSASAGGPVAAYASPFKNDISQISFNGNTYQYVAVMVSGSTVEMGGKIPNATMKMDPNWATIQSAISKYGMDGLRGTEVRKIRVYNNLLATPSEAQTQYFIIDSFEMSQSEMTFTMTLNNYGIDQMMGSATNRLPSNKCALKYRKWNTTTNSFDYVPYAEGGCPYGNPAEASKFSDVPSFGTRYYSNNDDTVGSASLDTASLRLSCCLKRFDPNNEGKPLPIKTSITRGTTLSGKGCS